MATPDQKSQPSPALFFATVRAYQSSAALKAAIELGLFTTIAEGNSTAAAIAQHWNGAERGARILCDTMVVLGFLTKQGTDYSLTADSAAFLDRKSPTYIGAVVDFLNSPLLESGFGCLTEAVRKGGTALPAGGTVSADNPVWVKFARGMANFMRMPAELMARRVAADSNQPGASPVRRVLDIAAGHGIYGITLARHFPDCEITAVDWPTVLEVAKENAALAGMAAQYKTIPGSAFDVEYGTGYDLVLLSNFLHHFNPETNHHLLTKVHAALSPSGRAVTVEFIPNDDRVSPPDSATFSLVTLAMTPAGDAYTFAELDNMFRDAGFRSSEKHALPPSPAHMVISRK
jgi:ubiquinone/menaquinone biosynthesis C-methylase UbiE